MYKKEDKTIRLVVIPMIDMSQFPELALPTKQNTFGYRWYSSDNPQYSPIDLTVAGIEAIKQKIIIKNLRTFFLENKYRECEDKIVLGILIQGQVVLKSITEWKYYINYSESPYLSKILKDNAPLTFME